MKRWLLAVLLAGCAPQELVLIDPWADISQKKEVEALLVAADSGGIPLGLREQLAGVWKDHLRRFDGLAVTPMEASVEGVRTLAERLRLAPSPERVSHMAQLADVDLVVVYELLGYHERPLVRGGQLFQDERPALNRLEVALRLRIGIYDRTGHLLWQNQGDVVDQLVGTSPTDPEIAAFREGMLKSLTNRLLAGLKPYYSYR